MDALERRTLLSGVTLQSVGANGGTQLTLTYEIQGSVSAFNVGFHRSADALLGGDTRLDTVTLSGADLTPGLHVKTFAIGAGVNEVALPGAGAAEVATDYWLLAAAELADAVPEDNVVAFSGVYHAAGKDVFVHGGIGADTATIDGTQLIFNGTAYAYAAADVLRFRVRGHDGSDAIGGSAAAKPLWLHGGTGDDVLRGGTLADTLFGGEGSDALAGGPGNDQLDGGQDGDAYVFVGSTDGTDRMTDTGISGVDRIVAGSGATQVRLGPSFSRAATGIEAISANGFASMSLLGAGSVDTLNFTGVTLDEVAIIDGGAAGDTIVGGVSDDVVKGGAGNDAIDGGDGRDVAVFTGRMASYSIVENGGMVLVTDLAPATNGDDGVDTLQHVEFLRFLDGEIAAPTANGAPVAVGDVASVTEDAAATVIDVLANDVDLDVGDTKSVVAVDGSGTDGWLELIMIYGVGVGRWHPGIPAILGQVAIAPDGQGVLYTVGDAYQHLRAGQAATETIFYTMQDRAGAQSSAQLLVSVVGVNDAPIARVDSLDVARNAAPQVIDVLANDTDVDRGDTRSVVAIDAAGILGTVAISANGASVVYSVGNAFLGLAAGQAATETFRYTIEDSTGARSTAEVTVTIRGGNESPVAVDDAAEATENGAAVIVDVLANDTDGDAGDTRTVVAVDGTGLQGRVTIAADGSSVTYTVGAAYQNLKAGATATESFTYTLEDAGGARSTAVVTVTITGVNDAPIAAADSRTVTEDSDSVVIPVLSNDVDVDVGDTRTVVSVETVGLKGTVTIAADGTGVVYSAGAAFQKLRSGQSASDVFKYTIQDGAGVRSTATVTVTVTGVNDAPVAVADAVTMSENSASTTIAVLGNDTDADLGDTRRLVSVDTTGLLGTVRVLTNGSIVYTPGNAFQGLIAGETATETFSYTMSDAAGEPSSASVTVTIAGVTDNAIALPDAAAAHEDGGSIRIDVLANDMHDARPGSPLTVVSVNGAGSPATIELIIIYGVGVGFINPGFPAVKGTIEVAPDGRGVIYTPHQSLRAGQTEVDFFKYTISDDAGNLSTAIVSVTVTGANDGPVAADDAVTITFDSPPLAIDVLGNDTDADAGDTLKVVSVSGTGLLGSVSVAVDGSGVLYAAGDAFQDLPFGQTATETFQYTIEDSTGGQSTASVVVTMTGRNRAPQAVDDAASAVEGGDGVTIDVLANDTDADVVDGDSVTLVSLDGTGLAGSIAVGADGTSVVYTVGDAFQELKSGATATETFRYTIADSSGLESTASVTVTVTGVNDGPMAEADTDSLSEDSTPRTIFVLDNDTDIDSGDELRVVSVDTAGLLGTVVISADGQSVKYTVAPAFQNLNAGQQATETFQYTIEDSAGARSTATVTLTIVGANEPVVYVYPPPPPPGAIVGTADDDILQGTGGNDVIYGQAGDDTIYGNAGNDSIFGGAGDDEIDGGDGNDILNGGSGRDDLTGGKGADTFRFYLASESTPLDPDRIRDFDASEGDKVDLSLIDASTTSGGNNAFVLRNSFSGVAGELVIYLAADGTTTVQGDVNGDGVADFLFEVRSKSPLKASDFLL